MREKKSRYVLVCQQLLALGTVAALAAPCTAVVSLDLVEPAPGPARGEAAAAPLAQAPVALVASHPVAPDVTEVPLQGVAKAGLRALPSRQAVRADGDATLAVLSAPQKVEGYATVGVTWDHRVDLAENQVSVSVRSLQHGRWSAWEPIQYHDDHGPDPGSAEARNDRPGTDPIVVGDVDQVQVKVETADGQVPDGTELAVVDPEATPAPKLETPAIDTSNLPAQGAMALSSSTVGATPLPTSTDPAATTDPTTDATADPTAGPTADGVLTGSAAGVTPKPQIFSRAQWGADESMRDKSALHYGEIHAGFVHHTVNANNYTRDQVPALIRGIYAYHTQSRGWSDIGYNFIVDRFGRIWEGRYGGVDRPVVGAHTLNYNEYSFAMSALGNFETGQPSSAMIDAYGRLFAWKLSLHGVSASSTKQWVGSRYFQAINGHRDAASTACPGKYLYAQLPTIRRLAAKYQHSFASRARSTNLAGSVWPDLLVRDKATKRGVLIRTGGQTSFLRGRTAADGWSGMDLIAAPGDLTGDGVPDVVARTASTKRTGVYAGTAQGGIGQKVLDTARFSGADQLVGALDITGDGKNDVVARMASTHQLFVYPGNGTGGFRKRSLLSDAWDGYDLTAGAGDLDGNGHDDLVVRRDGTLLLVPNLGGRLGTPVALPGTWGQFDTIAGAGDVTNDGRPDLVARVRKSQQTYVYPGDGHGGLGRRIGPFDQFKNLTWFSPVGQLVGDRSTDVLGRTSAGRMRVYPNNGARNVEAVVDTGIPLGDVNLILNVGDWNGDGYGDVMTRSRSTGDLSLRLGNGKGGFAAPVQVGSGWNSVSLAAAVGDVTGDGHPDLMGQPSGGSMRIYPGNGGTGFRPSYVAHSAITATAQTGLGLWTGDGTPDSLMRRSDGTLQLYPGNGPGGLMNPAQVGSGAGRYDWLQGVGDANGDGRADVIARETSTGTLWLLPGSSNGFGARRLIADGFGEYDLGS